MPHARKPAAVTKFDWFTDARFGLFIHWGLYSLLEGRWQGKTVPGIAECIQGMARIPVAEYEKLTRKFNPVRFDADRWAKMARAAGMRYVCITSKHCDGFAMYHSKNSSYNVVDATPFGRDVVRELARAVRKQGMTMCLYYSQVGDWHEPNGIGNNWDFGPDDEKDFQQFLDSKVKPQLREILTEYGPIGMVWFDVPSHITHEQSKSLADLVHELQPGCLINSRIGHGVGDYMSAPDNGIPANALGQVWETPATINETWGFKRDDENWKSPATIIRYLADIVSKGGNYLLNVGPRGDGTVPGPSVRVLQEVGKWMDKNADSIHGAKASPLPRQFIHRFGRCTAKADRLFLHVLKWPADNTLFVPGVRSPKVKAYLLADPKKRPLKIERVGRVDLRIALDPEQLPPAALDPVDTVVVLQFAGKASLDPSLLVAPDAPTVLNTFEARLAGPNLAYVDSVWDASIATTPTWADGAAAWAAVPEPTRYATITSVVNWRNPDETVAWDLRATKAGRYELAVTYAAGPEAAGSRASVSVGGQDFPLAVEPSGNWYEYKTVVLGTVEIARPGKANVVVKPVRIAGEWLMSLKNVTLTPVGYVAPEGVSAESQYDIKF